MASTEHTSSEGPPPDYVPYRLRRPYEAADSLDDLKGPTTGVVRLPVNIDWGPNPVYDLDQPGRLARMYEQVLSEALRVEYLNTYLDRDRLIELWPDLHLPTRVRQMWEERFSELRHGCAPGACPPISH